MTYKLSKMFSLTQETIDEVVTDKTSLGVYALDRGTEAFKIYYVGRTEKQPLIKRLKEYVGKKYDWFKFDYATSAKNAFEKECEIWHDHKPEDNEKHPERPDDSNWKCPRCKIYG